MKDEFKRAQFHGKGAWCNCCDVQLDKCKNSKVYRGRVRSRMKRNVPRPRDAEAEAYDETRENTKCGDERCECCGEVKELEVVSLVAWQAGRDRDECYLCPCDNHPPEKCETCRGACSCHLK